jgi:hypothetical protein
MWDGYTCLGFGPSGEVNKRRRMSLIAEPLLPLLDELSFGSRLRGKFVLTAYLRGWLRNGDGRLQPSVWSTKKRGVLEWDWANIVGSSYLGAFWRFRDRISRLEIGQDLTFLPLLSAVRVILCNITPTQLHDSGLNGQVYRLRTVSLCVKERRVNCCCLPTCYTQNRLKFRTLPQASSILCPFVSPSVSPKNLLK